MKKKCKPQDHTVGSLSCNNDHLVCDLCLEMYDIDLSKCSCRDRTGEVTIVERGRWRAGRLYQPVSLEPNTCAKGGGYWPTPCARDYRSPGVSRQRKAHLEERRGLPLSLWFKITHGTRLFPTFVELMMGYRQKYTALEPWAMQWYRSKLGRRSCG